MVLKDNAGLIKAYALVSYKDYQKAVTGLTPEEAVNNFLGGKTVVIDENELKEMEIIITKIEKVVMNGNTIIILVNNDGEIFSYNMSNGELRFTLLESGDTINVSVDSEGNINNFVEE